MFHLHLLWVADAEWRDLLFPAAGIQLLRLVLPLKGPTTSTPSLTAGLTPSAKTNIAAPPPISGVVRVTIWEME